MRNRVRIVAALAGVAFMTSWFVPVIEDGATLADGIVPGWQALRLALAPIWSYEGLSGGDGFWDVVSVASGLTNLLFLAAFAAIVTNGAAHAGRIAAVVAAATTLNAVWFVFADPPWALLAGYWLWLVAFALLAASAALARRSEGGRLTGAPNPAAAG